MACLSQIGPQHALPDPSAKFYRQIGLAEANQRVSSLMKRSTACRKSTCRALSSIASSTAPPAQAQCHLRRAALVLDLLQAMQKTFIQNQSSSWRGGRLRHRCEPDPDLQKSAQKRGAATDTPQAGRAIRAAGRRGSPVTPMGSPQGLGEFHQTSNPNGRSPQPQWVPRRALDTGTRITRVRCSTKPN
jgi:hypothetical protein